MTNPNENNTTYLPYMKLWCDEWLSSSIHYNCTLEEKGFFIDLMALGGKNRKERGCLSLEVGQPMPIEAMASALFLSVETCERLLIKMVEQDRVGIRADGVYFIKNFDYYQNSYRKGKVRPEYSDAEKEQRERGLLHHLQGKYQDEVKSNTEPVYVNEETGEIVDPPNDKYIKGKYGHMVRRE